MARKKYEALALLEQIHTYVGFAEFTKDDLPPPLRYHLGSLSTSGYLKRIRKTKDAHRHSTPVYCIAHSKYNPPRVPHLIQPEAHTQITNDQPDAI